MKVWELILALEHLDPEAEVIFHGDDEEWCIDEVSDYPKEEIN